MTERNDGLIDGTKSRSRWDFDEFKDFISAASQSFPLTGLHSKTEDCGKGASKTWSFKIWPRKTWIFFYLQLTLKLSSWLLTGTSMSPLQVTLTSRTLSVKEIPLVVKFIKIKDRQFPKKKKKKLWLCHGTYKFFVGVALNIWKLRVFQGVTETEHQAFREGVGGGRKREAKSN